MFETLITVHRRMSLLRRRTEIAFPFALQERMSLYSCLRASTGCLQGSSCRNYTVSAPSNVVLLLDLSGSTRGNREVMINAAKTSSIPLARTL